MQSRPRLLPVILAVATIPVLVLIRRLLDRFVNLSGLAPGVLGRNLVAELALLVMTVAIVAWARWWRPTGLLGPWRQPWWTTLVVLWLAMELLLGLPSFLQEGNLGLLPAVLPLVAMIGFCEETLTRGVMLYGLSRYGPLVAGLASAAIFGGLHTFNLLEGLPPSFVVNQVITAGLLGLLFAGVRMRSFVLWPMIVAHAVVDAPALLSGYPLHAPPVSPIQIVAAIDVRLPFGMAGLGLLLWEQLNGRNPLVDR